MSSVNRKKGAGPSSSAAFASAVSALPSLSLTDEDTHRPRKIPAILCMLFCLGALVVLLNAGASFPTALGSLAPTNVACMHEYPSGSSAMQGMREYMEDRMSSMETSDGAFHLFGMFDGHGGDRASIYCRETLLERLRQKLQLVGVWDGDAHVLDTAIWDTFVETDIEFARLAVSLAEKENPQVDIQAFLTVDVRSLKRMRVTDDDIFKWHRDLPTYLEEDPVLWKDGSTAVVAVLTPSGHVAVGNAGDSRAVMGEIVDGKLVTVELSRDHKPNDPKERARIEELGGFVSMWGVWRVNGVLATSRSIGDLHLKPYVSAKPDLVHYHVSQNSLFLILATDGVFDVLSSEEVVAFVVQHVASGGSLAESAEALVQQAYLLGSADNISALVVDLRSVSACNKGEGVEQKTLADLVDIEE
eukprot:TRINITY_DN12914_c0_g1_i1.p1 TRINITY_DN12914_c0_g1~~TRINITY_DN12914_c0_g1_i1.p1  ORF type:complete len:416 (-),score=66.94 TRINITY_DN12914_c0_g1_i1:32-1279(-)